MFEFDIENFNRVLDKEVPYLRRGEQIGSVSSLWYNKPMFQDCAALRIFVEHMFPFWGVFWKNTSFRVAAEKHCKKNTCSKSSANETPDK